jgi:hypothetical protein
VVGRAAAVIVLSLVVRLLFSSHLNPPFTWREQLVIWHAGLRGSIAMSLALTLPLLGQPADNELIITTTTIIVIWTVFFNGGTTALLLQLLQLTESEPIDTDHCPACKSHKTILTPSEHWSIGFDKRWIRPLLTHYQPEVGHQPPGQGGAVPPTPTDLPVVPTEPHHQFASQVLDPVAESIHRDDIDHPSVNSAAPRPASSSSAYPKNAIEQRSHRSLLSNWEADSTDSDENE